MKPTELSACEQARLIRTKQLSAEELLSEYESIYLAKESEIHAFITPCFDRAHEQAREIDRRIAKGETVGRLAGVPYTAKDVFCTEGLQTTAGAGNLRGWLPPYSATVIRRLEREDAILIGKVNCDEFGFGSTGEHTAYTPSPRNPRNPRCVPGGSSSGSAASVAAGECSFSLGSDTGGSIRQPASYCGIVGLKPTYGRVSRYGCVAFASSLDTYGPLTRSVADAGLILQSIAGPDPMDATSERIPVPYPAEECTGDIKGMRVGISEDFLRVFTADERETPIDPAVIQTIKSTASILRDLGAEIIENVPLSHIRYAVPAYAVLARVEAFSNLQRYDGLCYGFTTERETADMYDYYRKTRGEGFGKEAKQRILMGAYLSQADSGVIFAKARSARELIIQDFHHAFEKGLDAILAPAAPSAAPLFGAPPSDFSRYGDQFTVPVNFAGFPGIVFPAGFDAAGMPIGVQLIGDKWSEGKLLRLAAACERNLA